MFNPLCEFELSCLCMYVEKLALISYFLMKDHEELTLYIYICVMVYVMLMQKGNLITVKNPRTSVYLV